MAGGGLNDYGSLLKRAQEMQRKMSKAQAELAERMFEGKAGGGAVTAIVNGEGALMKLTIAKELVDPDDVDMLEDTIVAAVNAAAKDAESAKQQLLEGLTGGVNLPGMF